MPNMRRCSVPPPWLRSRRSSETRRRVKKPGRSRVSSAEPRRAEARRLAQGLLPVGNGQAAAGFNAVFAAGAAGAVGAAGAAFFAAFFAAGFFAAGFLAAAFFAAFLPPWPSWRGLLRRGLLRCGLLRRGLLRCGLLRRGLLRRRLLGRGLLRRGLLRRSLLRCGLLRRGLLRRRLLGRSLLRRGLLGRSAFFAVAISISLIKLQRAPRCSIQRGDSPPVGLPRRPCARGGRPGTMNAVTSRLHRLAVVDASYDRVHVQSCQRSALGARAAWLFNPRKARHPSGTR